MGAPLSAGGRRRYLEEWVAELVPEGWRHKGNLVCGVLAREGRGGGGGRGKPKIAAFGASPRQESGFLSQCQLNTIRGGGLRRLLRASGDSVQAAVRRPRPDESLVVFDDADRRRSKRHEGARLVRLG